MNTDFPTAPHTSGYSWTAGARRRGKVSSRLTQRNFDTSTRAGVLDALMLDHPNLLRNDIQLLADPDPHNSGVFSVIGVHVHLRGHKHHLPDTSLPDADQMIAYRL